MASCAVKWCGKSAKTSSYKIDGITFHRRNKWLSLIRREDLLDALHYRCYSVCQEHFTKDVIVHTLNRNILKAHALPSLCLPEFQTKKLNNVSVVSSSTQTEHKQVAKNIMEDIQENKEMDIAVIRHVLEKLCKKFLPDELAQLIKTQEKVTLGAKETYYEKHKSFCMNLYYVSPQFYNMLQTVLGLPNNNTLYDHLPITTEINNRLINALKYKIDNMTHKQKHCSLIIDCMPLTSHLSYDEVQDNILGFQEINGIKSLYPAVKVIIVMIRGIYEEWTQPAGYALLSEHQADIDLAHWINEFLKKLFHLGLYVRILNFVSEAKAKFFEKKWVTVDKPYFFVKTIKIYLITDPAVLMKSLLNLLWQYDFYFNNHVAKYEDIIKFYEMDKNSEYRLAPMLTDDHIYVTSPVNRKARHAVELLSKPVASGLSAYIDCGKIEGGRGTVDLIHKMSDFYECCNLLNDCTKNNRLHFSHNKSCKFVLNDTLIFLHNLKLKQNSEIETMTDLHPLIISFQITVNSFLQFYDDLNINKLTTNAQLSRTHDHDFMEEFFEQVRLRSENASEPTIKHFVTAFRELFILSATKPLKALNTKVEYKSKYDLLFTEIKRNITANPNTDTHKNYNEKTSILKTIYYNSPNDEDIAIPYSDYNEIDTAEKHTLIYVSGYLLKKCKERHKNCQGLQNYIDGVGTNITIDNISKYLQYSQKHKLSLIAIPSDQFVQIVEKLEEAFRTVFIKQQIKCKVEQTLLQEMIGVYFPLPCLCFPRTYLIKLFIRLRINYTLQLNNREFLRNQNRVVLPLLLST